MKLEIAEQIVDLKNEIKKIEECISSLDFLPRVTHGNLFIKHQYLAGINIPENISPKFIQQTISLLNDELLKLKFQFELLTKES